MNHTRDLNVMIDLNTLKKIKSIGSTLDLNRNGLYDVRMGAINVWCSPDDKPQCWQDVTKGVLDYPRDLVGTISWRWAAGNTLADLYIDLSPYELLLRKEVSPEEWQMLFSWIEGKALDLIRMAQ